MDGPTTGRGHLITPGVALGGDHGPGGQIGLSRLLGLRGFSSALILRGVVVWVAVRIGGAFAGIANPDLIQEVFILGVVGVALVVDVRRRNENLFLGNLGVSLAAIVTVALSGAAILESLVP